MCVAEVCDEISDMGDQILCLIKFLAGLTQRNLKDIKNWSTAA